jgi:hypothetical protein
MMWLCGGGLAVVVVGCGGGGGPAPGDGGSDVTSDGGSDATGDGGAAATCGNVQPCGGDVVGNWMFVEQCQSAASIAASKANFSTMAAGTWCPGQTLVGIEPQASGSLILDGAGAYALDLVFGGHIDINFPASCIAGASCDDATTGFQAQIEEGTFPIPSATSIACSGASSCVCHTTVNRIRSEAGTYSMSGNVLSLAATSGAVTNKSICVAGSQLHILDTATGQTTIDSDLVAMKQ